MPKIHEMITSKFLKKEDVGRGALVTIQSITRVNVAIEGAEPELKYAMSFKELEKPMVLNSTNIQICAQICESDDTDGWIGKRVVLYNDPNVSFAGKLTGGIRIRKPKPGAVQPTPEPEPEFDDSIPF